MTETSTIIGLIIFILVYGYMIFRKHKPGRVFWCMEEETKQKITEHLKK